MQTQVTEIAADTFRICTYHSEYKIQFNQFLVVDDEPFLMHTGMRRMFDATLSGVRKVMDPARLRWIGYSHFEPDECGALNHWLQVAPSAQAVAGVVGNVVMLTDFADRPARALDDDEVLAVGKHRLRFLATPHLPHGWDAGLYFDETEKTLFCSDLFFHGGNPAPLTEGDVVGAAAEAIHQSLNGPLAHDLPYTPYTERTLQRVAALHPAALAIMHGSSWRGDGHQAIIELSGVLREALVPVEQT